MDKLNKLLRVVDLIEDKEESDQTTHHGHAIVVLDRGFVYYGDVDTTSQWLTIRDAQNIRQWGTTKGLGELATSGPTSKTVLDLVGLVKAPMRSVISIIPTVKSW